MPVIVPVVRTGNVALPQSVPAQSVGMLVSGNSYAYDTVDDYYAADIAPHLGSNVLSTPLTVSASFAGLHYHSRLPTVRYSVTRNVDVLGCLWSGIGAAGRGLHDWSALDGFVGTAAAAGRDVIFCFVGTPTWASARPMEPGHYGNGSDAEPRDLGDLADFAAAVCSRYLSRGTRIAAFEIWNEPKFAGGGTLDQGNYFTGTPSAMAAMARVVSVAVKAVDPAALVLSPSPTGLEFPWVAGDGSGTDHLDAFLGADDGAGGHGSDWVDIVAFHAYSHTGLNDVFAIPQMVTNVRTTMALHGLAGRRIWITETSAITPPLTSYVGQHQVDYIGRTLLLALGAGVERVVWYGWDDPLGFADAAEVQAGWDAWLGVLAGGALSLVNALEGKKVAALLNGVRHLV